MVQWVGSAGRNVETNEPTLSATLGGAAAGLDAGVRVGVVVRADDSVGVAAQAERPDAARPAAATCKNRLRESALSSIP
jgi:hypothetical protein